MMLNQARHKSEQRKKRSKKGMSHSLKSKTRSKSFRHQRPAIVNINILKRQLVVSKWRKLTKTPNKSKIIEVIWPKNRNRPKSSPNLRTRQVPVRSRLLQRRKEVSIQNFKTWNRSIRHHKHQSAKSKGVWENKVISSMPLAPNQWINLKKTK